MDDVVTRGGWIVIEVPDQGTSQDHWSYRRLWMSPRSVPHPFRPSLTTPLSVIPPGRDPTLESPDLIHLTEDLPRDVGCATSLTTGLTWFQYSL